MRYLDTAAVTSCIGMESMNDINGSFMMSDADKAEKFLGHFSQESNNKCLGIIQKYTKPLMESAHVDEAVIRKDYWTNVSTGLEKAAHEYTKHANRYNLLPADVKRMIDPIRSQYLALESELANITTGKRSKEYKIVEYKKRQAQFAMESILYSHLANLQNRQMSRGMFGAATPGMESYTYQDAIFYPKLEAMTQWVNTTAAIYPKLIKMKQLVNETASVPVHTQEVWIIFYDAAGNEVRRCRREELYNNMNTDAFPEAYQEFTRTLTLKKADFSKMILLKQTVLTGETTPFLSANEIVRSDAYITSMKINGVDTPTGKIYDYKAGKMLSETFNEMDWKGKVIPFVLDAKEPNKIYWLSVLFDGAEQSLMFTISKSDDSMADIDEITIEFKIHDIYMVQKTNTDFFVREVRSFIQAGAMSRIEVPLAQTELDILDARLQGNFLNKITNLASEYITQSKDTKFYKGYMAMKNKLKADYAADPSFKLYADQKVSMGIPDQVNKVEALNMYLGSAFDILIEKLNVMANTQADTQLNLFCHSMHLPVLKPILQVITGTVEDETNGKFLGVQQEARVNILTLGSETSSPVNSVVVGTDKMDLMTKGVNDQGAHLAAQDIEYFYHVLPYFKETNLETNLMVETPTRVISDNAVRSNRRPFIPNMFMEYSSEFKTLRAAAADLSIKGYYANATF